LVLVFITYVSAGNYPGCIAELASTPAFDPTIVAEIAGYYYSDFNVYTFATFTATTGDIEGRMYTLGSATIGQGFSIGAQLPSTPADITKYPYTALIGQNLNFGQGAVYPQGTKVLLGGSYVGPRQIDSIVVPNFNIDDNWGDLTGYYDLVQTNLYALTCNVLVVILNNGIRLSSTVQPAPARYVVCLTAAQISSSTWFDVDASINTKKELIINVVPDTTPVTLSGAELPFCSGKVIYNIGVPNGQTRTIYVKTQIQGSILAPESDIIQTGGVINGWVIVNDGTFLQVNLPLCSCP